MDGAMKIVDGMHNLEVAGAIPVPATEQPLKGGFLLREEVPAHFSSGITRRLPVGRQGAIRVSSIHSLTLL